MSSIALEVTRKLKDLGGEPPFKSQLIRIKSALSWRDPSAESRIRHLVRGEQRATPEQVDQIRLAHARLVVAKLRGRSQEDAALFQSLKEFIEIAHRSDSGFYGQMLEEIGDLIDHRRGHVGVESVGARRHDRQD
jgi:hypothetical protein